MNWKTTFILLLIGSMTSFLIPFLSTSYYGALGLVIIVIRAAIFLPVILYALELNKTIETGSKSKQLRVFEVMTYFTAGLLILGMLSTLFLMTQGRYRYALQDSYILFLAMFAFAVQLILVIALFKSYKIRRLKTNGFKTSADSDFDILDDFDDEVENAFPKDDLLGTKVQYLGVDDRIKVCQVCTKKGFNPKVGIVCGLTEEKPDFVEFCTLYNEDPKAKVLASKTTIKTGDAGGLPKGSWKGAIVMAVFGFIRAAMKGLDDPLGIIFLVLGIGWLIIAGFSENNKR